MKTFIYSLLITLPLLSFSGNIITLVANEDAGEVRFRRTLPTCSMQANTFLVPVANEDKIVLSQDYEIHRDIVMNTQGNSKTTYNNNMLILPKFKLIGPCILKDNEKKISLLAYYTSKGVSIYSPSNATNIIKNYRCNGVQYEALVAPAEWTATRFRVLLPSNKRQQAIYEAYNSGTITNLSGDLFKGISEPSSSAVRYSKTEEPAANVCNTTNAFLIWVQIPTEQGNINALIHIKEVTENENLSSIKFDLIAP